MPIEIKHYPIFEKGTFQKHPEVFDRFLHHASSYLMKKFEKSRIVLSEYEDEITWPLITGPGFSAATHPGSDSILINTMFEGSRYVYNSDCLYINPQKKVFAVSDPPGVTTSSRRLFKKLDRYLSEESPNGLEKMINRLNGNTSYNDNATLSLVYIPEETSQGSSSEAIVYVAGDTILFHGNLSRNTLCRIDGNPHFIGTTHAYFEPRSIRFEPEDLFIIASDGIASLLSNNPEEKLEEVLLRYLNDGVEGFISTVVEQSNAYYRQMANDNEIPRFGGNDNVSVLVVYPDQLVDTDSQDTFMLGGYTTV